jgi:hypothetical protein
MASAMALFLPDQLPRVCSYIDFIHPASVAADAPPGAVLLQPSVCAVFFRIEKKVIFR